MRRKILLVTSNFNRGGAQRVIMLLANRYVADGWDVHMVCLLDNKIEYELSPEIVIHDMCIERGKRIFKAVKWISRMRGLIKKERFDVIFSYIGRVNIITLAAAKGLNVPVIISEGNDPRRDRRNRFEMALSKYCYGKASKVIFQTRYQQEYYKKQCARNSVVIGNPISAPVYRGEHTNGNIICVGKLMPQKNHAMMIRAFAKIADKFPDKQVFIYGEGEERGNLQAQIDSLGLTDRVHLCGLTDRIFEIMREYRYFVMCSDYEGLSNALLEAMVSGMICITTAWSGADEIIRDGENGYMVPVGNDDALAKKLSHVFTNDCAGIAESGIAEGSKFTMEKIFPLWIKEINGLVLRHK